MTYWTYPPEEIIEVLLAVAVNALVRANVSAFLPEIAMPDGLLV